MSADLGLVAAGVGGNIAGNAAGNAMGGSGNITSSTPAFVSQMNRILSQAMGNALNTSTGYTNQAINQQNASLGAATGALQNYLGQATNAATTNANLGLAQYQSLQAPFANAGYGALDAYQDSLGLSRPKIGSQAISQALFNNNNLQNQIHSLGGLPQVPGAAPTAPQLGTFTSQITPQMIDTYIQQNTVGRKGSHPLNPAQYTGVGAYATQNGIDAVPGATALFGNSQITGAVQNYLAQQQYQQAMNQYNTQMQAYNQNAANANTFNNYLSNSGFNPQQMQIANAYNNGLFSR